jgi:hypothetical protein
LTRVVAPLAFHAMGAGGRTCKPSAEVGDTRAPISKGVAAIYSSSCHCLALVLVEGAYLLVVSEHPDPNVAATVHASRVQDAMVGEDAVANIARHLDWLDRGLDLLDNGREEIVWYPIQLLVVGPVDLLMRPGPDGKAPWFVANKQFDVLSWCRFNEFWILCSKIVTISVLNT